jgi:hypothetical protein
MTSDIMRTILQDLREVIAKEIEHKFMPIHVCVTCDNIAEGALVQRIVAAIRDEDSCH